MKLLNEDIDYPYLKKERETRLMPPLFEVIVGPSIFLRFRQADTLPYLIIADQSDYISSISFSAIISERRIAERRNQDSRQSFAPVRVLFTDLVT